MASRYPLILDGTTVKEIQDGDVLFANSFPTSGVSASTYGGAAVQPVITVDTYGRITSASNVTSTVANTSITGNIISSQIQPTGVTAATYGNATFIPSIVIDQQGRITAASNVALVSSGGGGGGNFNTSVNRNVGYQLTSSTAAAFTAPATTGIRYVVHSIHVTNISTSNAAEVSGSFDGTTYASNIAFCNTVPVPLNSSVELLKRPKVLQPSDKIQINANVDATLHAVITYETQTSTSYFGAGADVTSAATYTTLHTATGNCVVESILLTNDDSTTLDVKARVVWTDGADAIQGYYCFDLIVPNDSTIEVLEAPKYLESGHKIRVYANQANRLEAIISGKNA